MPQPKLIVILGATGNQGGSVARRFLADPTYRVRGITRNPSSRAAQALAALGAEIVAADLDDPASLRAAFAGANLIFSVTNYWEPFFRDDCRREAAERGESCRRYAYEVERRQGMNVADAAAAVAVGTLVENGFLVSTLSHARKCTGGKMEEVYHFDSKAEVFPDYVRDRYPELAAKMSCVQTGYFMVSYKMAKRGYFRKVCCAGRLMVVASFLRCLQSTLFSNAFEQMEDGSFTLAFTTHPDKLVPHLDVVADTGNFVYVVAQRPPGDHYMAAGTNCSWAAFMQTWLRTTGQQGRYEQVTMQQMIDGAADAEFGREIAEMFTYTSEPGYDGGMRLITAEDMRREGIECPMTTWEEFCAREDWSAVLDGSWS